MSEYTEEEILTSYKGRCSSDKKELGVGYMGSCSIEVHRQQMLDPESWVHSGVSSWIKEGRTPNLAEAAPDMYEALKILLDSTERIRENACSCGLGEMCSPCEAASIARVALAKAEGREE